MKHTSFTLRGVTAAVLIGWGTWAQAQTPVADPGAVLRNIDQGLPAPSALPTPSAVPAPATSGDFNIGKLLGVQVESGFMPDEIQAYWLPYLNRSVASKDIADFKTWLWEQLQAKGVLAYVVLSDEVGANGSMLKVKVSAPSLGRVTVAALDESATDPGSRPYVNEVARRVARAYSSGSLVDLQGISARLNAITYDLPVTLNASLNQPDGALIDVVINMRLLKSEPGRLAEGLVQVNNHGLKDYGQTQLVSQVRIEGESPLTEYTATGQVSKGVTYLSGERTAAIPGWQSRSKLFASATRTDTTIDGISVKSNTSVIAGKVNTLLQSDRDSNTVVEVGLGRRQTHSQLAGATDTKRSDNRLAATVKMAGAPGWVTGYRSEMGVSVGRIGIESALDRDPRGVAGNYQILSFDGAAQKTLSSDKLWSGQVRWRAQKAFQNLDSYNQFALGGPSGIRAYTSSDGVGDEGVQLSIDLNRRVLDSLWAGVHYDVGRVTQNIDAVNGVKPGAYTLSGAGVQVTGDHGKWRWNASLSKGLDKTEPFETAVTEALEKWRGTVALDYRF